MAGAHNSHVRGAGGRLPNHAKRAKREVAKAASSAARASPGGGSGAAPAARAPHACRDQQRTLLARLEAAPVARAPCAPRNAVSEGVSAAAKTVRAAATAIRSARTTTEADERLLADLSQYDVALQPSKLRAGMRVKYTATSQHNDHTVVPFDSNSGELGACAMPS